ncbi:MAG: hypothetical protein ACYC27_04010 [Armatimonadota bacterium]
MRTVIILITMTMAAVMACNAGEKMYNKTKNDEIRVWADSALTDKPIDIAPWTYEWRADRAVQEKPEAYFIPRRLDRLDKVYRTAYYELSPQELKSIYYDLQDLLKPLLPKPEGELQAGLLWTGGLVDYKVELHWAGDVKKIPSPESVEVRVYPTAFGWFGWTADKILSSPMISKDKRTWTYKSDPKEIMDFFGGSKVPAASEMVAVFSKDSKSPIPDISVTGPDTGTWKRMDVEIEWGFQSSMKSVEFDGNIEPYVALVGPITPLSDNNGVTVAGERGWQSKAAGNSRRGITFPLLYASTNRPGLDSRVTVWSKTANFTFSIRDLENGPIFIPEHGVFVTKAGSGQNARQFTRDLAAKTLKSFSEMTREHSEVGSFDELIREVRLSTCPDGTVLAPFPKVDDPKMQVELSDKGWTDAWRAGSNQFRGENMWGGLAWEAARTAHQMDLVGMHDRADRIYTHFLRSPGVRADGDYVDANGALEWATDMRHDMGYSHDGTHASTGRLLYAMCERYLLTGDREWFAKNRTRLQAAADWIIRQRTLYLKDIPKHEELLVAGLMPTCMWGDYAIPSSDWRWYYLNDAFSMQGLQRFADALTNFYSEEGYEYKDESVQYHHAISQVVAKEPEKYRKEAEDYRKDIRRSFEMEAALSPVRRLSNGTYCSYVPIAAYSRGLMLTLDLKAPQRPQCDVILGSLPLAESSSAIDANDMRMKGTLEVMEETGMSEVATNQLATRKAKGLSTEDAWFWNSFGGTIPKLSHNASIYLLQDDVPNFLRFWMNSYALMIGSDGKMWEWGRPGDFSACTAPDNGTCGWFMENFRNLLVMEDGQSLWIARATPRSWMEQGKKISVKNAPTCFGDLAYEIISDVDNGRITATIEIPDRDAAEKVILRFRHPQSTPIKSVTLNGKPWDTFNPDKETIEIKGLTGKAVVVASY